MIWDHPVSGIREAIHHLVSSQRVTDTNGEKFVLFAGKLINESDLPWYYLPVWILLSTPVVYSILFLTGQVLFLKKKINDTLSVSLFVIFWIVLISVAVIRPTDYNGWRHFYFLYVPVFWFSIQCLDHLFRQRKSVRVSAAVILSISFAFSIIWIAGSHPNQNVYINPLLFKISMGEFDRGYYTLPGTDCLYYALANEEDERIDIIDSESAAAWGSYDLHPTQKARIHYFSSVTNPSPPEYIILQYTQEKDNEVSVPLYTPVHSVQVFGLKLADLYQRSHLKECKNWEIISGVKGSSSVGFENAVDGNYETYCQVLADINGGRYIEVLFSHPIDLNYIEVFHSERSLSSKFNILITKDEQTWKNIEAQYTGLNSWEIKQTGVSAIRLQNDDSSETPWEISNIVFYEE